MSTIDTMSGSRRNCDGQAMTDWTDLILHRFLRDDGELRVTLARREDVGRYVELARFVGDIRKSWVGVRPEELDSIGADFQRARSLTLGHPSQDKRRVDPVLRGGK